MTVTATTTRHRRPGAHRATGIRTLHLVDLENLLGPVRLASDVAAAWAAYAATLRLDRDDHVVVGTGPLLAAVAWFELPQRGLRRVVGRGINGADLVLMQEVQDLDAVARAYQRLVIASGDGLFTDTARRCRAAGLQVVQVLGRGGGHPNLARECDRQVRLGLGDHPGEPLAA
ncbi:hypothetical protein [Geodermatophilus sp. SYSU D01176]